MDPRSLSSGQRYQLSATCTPPIPSYTVNTNNKSSPLKLSDCEIERERSYAMRSMRGAQCFSAMSPLSFLLAFSTVFWYSALTVGYCFVIFQRFYKPNNQIRNPKNTYKDLRFKNADRSKKHKHAQIEHKIA